MPDTMNALLLDPRFWLLLFVFATPFCAIEIIVYRNAIRLIDRAFDWLNGKLTGRYTND